MMGSYYDMVNHFEEEIAAFVAMPERRQIAKPKNLTLQILIGKGPNQIAK